MEKIALFIPTYNAGDQFDTVLRLINKQDGTLGKKFIIDSGSNDDTIEIATRNNFGVYHISQNDFTHGRVRTEAAKVVEDFDFLICMTQDVFLQDRALSELINFIRSDNNIAVAYGKQDVDLKKGSIFESRARSFNYGEKSLKKSSNDIAKYGIKTVFSSNAFAIYDLKKLKEIDFFPEDLNFSEDMDAAAKFIKKGYFVGYCATAKVFHTHNYTVKEEFNRYRKIGKFHKEYPKIQQEFGSNSSEGIKLVFNELVYLIKNKQAHLILESLCRNLAKFLGYKLA